jgi:hypothetical protein
MSLALLSLKYDLTRAKAEIEALQGERNRLLLMRKPLLDFCREVIAKEKEVGTSEETVLAFLAEKARNFLVETNAS